MSLEVATWVTAAATVVLAAFAVIAAWFARKAFLKQSDEVAAIEQQVVDEQEVTQQQAELLKVQTGQLEVLRAQLDDQRKASVAQAEVLELQAAELRDSLEERKRETEERRRMQATVVTCWLAEPDSLPGPPLACVRNASGEPIFDVRIFFHLAHRADGAGWAPVDVGGPPPDQTMLVVPPMTDKNVAMPDNVRSMFGSTPVTQATCVVSMEFTDAAGNRWERDPRGALNPRA